MGDEPLKNQRWERFCQALAKGETADAAYVIAGFKPNRGNAARLKATESIKARVAAILRKSAERIEIDQAWIKKKLVVNIERSMQTVENEALGVEAPGPLYNVTAANRGLELLGKDLGMFRETVEHTGKDGAAIQVEEHLSEESRTAFEVGRRVMWLLAQGRKRIMPPALEPNQE